MMRTAAFATLALCGAACTSLAVPPPVASSEWRIAAINGHATPPAPAPYRMSFKTDMLGGQFGCNHFGGDYRVNGDTLTTGAVAMTEMACPGPADQFEGWGLAIIQRPMRIVGQDMRRVTLSNEVGSIDLAR